MTVRATERAEHDVIVVGAGSSGAPLAARLSEDPHRSVLLLEAGPAYERIEDFPREILDPSLIGASTPGHPCNWSLVASVVPGRTSSIARGRVIGGSSALNGALFIRATPENFAHWVKLGNDAWSYDNVLPYFRRSETDLDFGGELHGSNGPILVRREPDDRAPRLTDAFTRACVEMGFPVDPDKNGPGGDGVGAAPMNIAHGMRMSTGLAYLVPSVHRSNLEVRGGTFVRRVLFDGARAIGVEAEVDGALRTFHGSDVVLSAGAVLSPHILMLSGIGPADELRTHGIPVVHDSPGVGAALVNHTELLCAYRVDHPIPVMRGRGTITAALHWTADASDLPGDLEILPFVSSLDDLLGGSRAVLRRPLQTLLALRGTSIRQLLGQVRRRNDLLMALTLVQPESRGRLSLSSADPHVQPRIDYAFLNTDSDRRRMRECVRVAVQLLASAPMRAIRAGLVDLNSTDIADAAVLDRWIDAHLYPSGHPTSTCRMGPSSDGHAVVDQEGRVRGVEGLRVVDVSIFPYTPSRGPNATAVMVGERMADLMAGRVGLTSRQSAQRVPGALASAAARA